MNVDVTAGNDIKVMDGDKTNKAIEFVMQIAYDKCSVYAKHCIEFPLDKKKFT